MIRKTILRRRVIWVAMLLLVTWSLLAWVGARALVVQAEMEWANALVILSGSSTYLERTHRAAQLFMKGRAPRIIVTNDVLPSGWSSEQQRNPLFVEREVEELQRAGVPREKIEIVPKVVSSTHDEALALREYAVAKGVRSILVVTSAYHSRRALWTLRHVFRETGIEVGMDPVDPGWQSPSFATWWWSQHGWRMVAGEYLKMVYYWLRYR